MSGKLPNTRARTAQLSRTAALSAPALALTAWVYLGWVRPNTAPENFGVVEAGKVYRSAALTPAATRRVHDERGIRTIVDLGGYDKDPAGERVAQRTAEALGVERYVFELEGDGTGNPNAYVAALRVIADRRKQPVLVHCSAGAQRTSACVMLYKDAMMGQPLDMSYREARLYRHDPDKNPRLLPYVQEHRSEILKAFMAGSQIENYPKVELRPRSGK